MNAARFVNSFMTEAVIRANQWTGFHIITASVMKELMNRVIKIEH